MYMGETIKTGFNPVSTTEMYLLLTEPREKPDSIDEADLPNTLKSLLAEFGGEIAKIRDELNGQSRIVYRPFYEMLLQPPWHRGRVVLIGDAVHATTPHLASGAGMGVEDAVVLAEELAGAPDCASALEGFTDRRFNRCRLVVENSVRLGNIERAGGPKEEHSALMRESMSALLAPF